MREFKVKPAAAGQRLDVVVAGQYPQFTRSSLGALFDKNMVSVNRIAAKPSHKVKPGDKIVIDETYLNFIPEPINLPVIFEDKDVVVIDKPAGILTHSKGALNLEATVASFIKERITDESLTGNRAGIVHRLDRETSGVIIAAKNRKALRWLQKQFSTRKVKKTYIALVEGVLEPSEAIIDTPLARNPKRPQSFSVLPIGKQAITHYKLINKIVMDNKSYSLAELQPITGRTHQLRVHMAYMGHPIVGDKVYGHGGSPLMLHAKTLEITLPSGLHKIFTAKLPQHLQELVKNG